MRFIRQAVEICPVGATVATKTDLCPDAGARVIDAPTSRTCARLRLGPAGDPQCRPCCAAMPP